MYRLRASLFFFCLLVYATSYAISVRVPADTACLEEYVYFDYNYKSENYRDAAINWRKLMLDCPTLYESLYLNGETLFKALIEAESSEDRKIQMIDTLILIQDLRIKYYGKEGFVLGKKGVLLCKYKPNELELAYHAFEVSVGLRNQNQSFRYLTAISERW